MSLYLKMMDFIFKMMDFIFKMMGSVLKTMKFEFKIEGELCEHGTNSALFIYITEDSSIEHDGCSLENDDSSPENGDSSPENDDSSPENDDSSPENDDICGDSAVLLWPVVCWLLQHCKAGRKLFAGRIEIHSFSTTVDLVLFSLNSPLIFFIYFLLISNRHVAPHRYDRSRKRCMQWKEFKQAARAACRDSFDGEEDVIIGPSSGVEEDVIIGPSSGVEELRQLFDAVRCLNSHFLIHFDNVLFLD